MASNVTLSEAKGLAGAPDCHPEGSEGSVILSEAKDLAQILRFTQDDKAVLPAALWPTRAHARVRLMPIIADLSASCGYQVNNI